MARRLKFVVASTDLPDAGGPDAAWVAVVDGGGTLRIYDLAENPPATVVATLASLPHPATFVRLGGAANAGAPPDAVLVYANTGNQAVIATKSGGTSFTSVSAATSVGGHGCGEQPGSIGAVAPQSTGTGGNGTISQCFITKSGTGSLAISTINGVNNNTSLVFDAGYDRSTNFVVISGDGNRGLVKSASENAGVPSFPPGDAQPGVGSGSGGVAVNGLIVPVVKDTAFGPAGASQLAVMLSMSGGGLAVASDDGGATFTTVVPKGGNAVDWWTGTSGSWLVFGHGGGGDVLSAAPDWTSASEPLFGPNVTGADTAALGMPGNGNASVTALRGVPGANGVFVGLGADATSPSASGALYYGTLGGNGPVTLAGGTIATFSDSAVTALAYCPTIGSDPRVADVLLVARASGGSGGGITRIAGATSGSPAATTVLSNASVNDVRLHCGTGTAYAGAGTNSGGPSGALYKSTDGGQTFSPVTLSAGLPPNLNVQVVAVSPDDADSVMIAGNSEGVIARSTDGGGTWTIVNDPHAGGRNFLSEGVGDLEIPPAASADRAGRVRAVVTGASTLVGTGGGVFSARFTGGGGGGGGGCSSAAQCDDDDACTTDTCTAGACAHSELPTSASITCELDELAGLADCADTKTLRQVRAKVAKLRALVAKISASTKAKRTAKLKKSADALMGGLAGRVGRAKRSASACKGEIRAQLGALRSLVAGL